ncbi:AzlD domain-containing protein [Candidatus Pyrohabitans sp.]
MKGDLLVAVLIVAMGTYLMRALPLGLMLTRRKELTFGKINRGLSLAGPALISALFVVSIFPSPQEFVLKEMLMRMLAITAVYLSQRKWSNLGVAVMSGVVVYGLLKILIQ